MSRVRFLFTLIALAAVAGALAACGGDGGNGDPQAVVDDATLEGIESADLDLSLGIRARGDERGNIDASISGPFQTEEGEDLPLLDMSAKVNGTFDGDDVNFDGGLVLLPNSAYVNYEGTNYEVDPTTFSFVESAIENAQQPGGGGEQSSDLTACQEAAGEIEAADFIDNLTDEGSAEVGGTSTTRVSGDLNVSVALDSMLKLVEDPACEAQLGAAGSVPSTGELKEARSDIQSAVKNAKIDLYVGDDDIVRRLSAKLKIEPEESSGEGPGSVVLEVDLSLTGVNEEQDISAPKGKARPISKLFVKLGVNPLELLGTLSGEGEGFGNLLEGLNGLEGVPGLPGGSGGGGNQQAYLECLQGARTPTDLEKCAGLR